MQHYYKPENIEPKWQQKWEDHKLYETETDIQKLKQKPKYYVLDMFPYPSGAGLHVGHPEGYTATDVISRYKRMRGFHVLHPMGWDAFGLPAERAAMRENIHPAKITKRNVDNFRRQIKRLGFSYDWQREISTTDANYYRWTQFIFLKLYEKGLAYLADVPVNWCPALNTVLANEEVKDGFYVETGDPVEKKVMRQWMLKITAYAEKLIEDLDELDWPEGVKDMQRNWIGKSYGAQMAFQVANTNQSFEIFTTRPDTLFGATYCVLAPEHPLVDSITTTENKQKVSDYVNQAKNKSDLSRTELNKEKTGVFTGAYAINPVNQKQIPIWVADYVLLSYGTGAIMAVPAHDERDHEFAKKYDLPIVQVIDQNAQPIDEKAHTGNGKLVNSDFINDLEVDAAQQKMLNWLEEKNLGKKKVQYRLRDWLFSRQRYWGEPIPVLFDEEQNIYPVSPDDLPIELPSVDEYKPTTDGSPPLARADESWLHPKNADGKRLTRETNTMPQWAGSCWYYLRYIDPQNNSAPFDNQLEKYWMPVDLYIGGVEHAVLHLLYARFWHKVLYDCGLVSTKEPFQKLFNQGMILAYSYRDQQGKYYGPDDVIEKNGEWFTKKGNQKVATQIEKMSKSKLNVVNPDFVIDRYGADSMRLYELFMGPLEQTKPWQMDGVEGVFRFLARVWRLVIDEKTGKPVSSWFDNSIKTDPSLKKALHLTIKKVGEDLENLKFNTAISQMMSFVNLVYQTKTIHRNDFADFLKVLCPFAPHLAEEIWHTLNFEGFVVSQEWPVFDKSLLIENTVNYVIQINGKRKAQVELDKSLNAKQIEEKLLNDESITTYFNGVTPKRVIVVPNRLVNFVVVK